MGACGYYGLIVNNRCFVAYQPTDMHLFRQPVVLVREAGTIASNPSLGGDGEWHLQWENIAERVWNANAGTGYDIGQRADPDKEDRSPSSPFTWEECDGWEDPGSFPSFDTLDTTDLVADMDTLRHPNGALVSVIADIDREVLTISRGSGRKWVPVRSYLLESMYGLRDLGQELRDTEDRNSTYGNLAGGVIRGHEHPRTLSDPKLTTGVLGRPTGRGTQVVGPVDPVVAAVRRAEARGVPLTATPASGHSGREREGGYCGLRLDRQWECRNWTGDGGLCHLHRE